jgi:guanyl-specific ribonuclease Sa
VSATPEQIADVVARYSRDAYSKAEVASRTEGLEHAAPQMFADADHLRIAAALIRQSASALAAHAERVRVLEDALKPFSYASDGLEDGDYDARIVAWIGNAEPNNGGAYGLHASDFRRARAALKAAP